MQTVGALSVSGCDMKSLLWLLPVLILLALLAYFRSPEEEGAPSSKRKPDPARPLPAETRGTTPTPLSTRPVAATRATGAFRIRVRSQGKGLAGAKVEMREVGGPQEKTFATAPDGCQSVLQVPVGAYLVLVRSTRHVPRAFPVEIRAGQTTELDVDLVPGGQIAGIVVDGSGRPAPETYVSLTEAKTTLFVLPELAVRTDAAGRYLLDGVPVQEFGMHFRHADFKPVQKTGILLRDTHDLLQVDVVLDRGTAISGRIVDPDDRPIPGALVLAFTTYSTAVNTDSAGKFAISGMLDQEISLIVSAPGFGTRHVWGLRPNTEGVQVQLARGGSVRGRFSAEAPPGPIQVALTRYETSLGRDMQRFPKVDFGEDGTFLLSDLDPGVYRIDAASPGHATLDRPTVTVVSGQETGGIVIRLQKSK